MRRTFMLSVAVLCFPFLTQASDLDDAANELAKVLVAATASADPAVHSGAVEQIYSADVIVKIGNERLTGLLGRLHSNFGKVELHHTEVVSVDMGGRMSHVAHVFARSAKGEWHDFQFRLDPGPPVRFTELAFVAQVTEPVALPAGDIRDKGTLEWLDRYVTKLAQKEQLSGAMLIAVGDEVLYERYFGMADAKGETPVTADTRFSLGSGNKLMTALLAARLVEEGKLLYSTKLRAKVPEFPQSADADLVTLHHLLSHTSGIGEYWTKEYAETKPDLRTAHDFLPWVVKRGFDFKPGTDHRYSNSNFILAGLAVEKAGGVTYEEALHTQIFAPLGMTSSSLSNDGKGAFAEPLVRDGEGWKHSGLRGRGSPAGGAWSTPRDMLRFARGLRAGKIVPPAMLDLMTTSKTSQFPGAESYGYGFILQRHGMLASYGHGGTAPGVNFELRIFPKPDITFVIMSNQDNGAYDDLRKNTVKLITGMR